MHVNTQRKQKLDFYRRWYHICALARQDSGLVLGEHEEHTPASSQTGGATSIQMSSMKWLVHIFDPAGCWKHPSLLQLGWRALTPASSQAVPLAPDPEGRAPGRMGPVADSLMPRWLSQQAAHENGRHPDIRQRWIRKPPPVSPPSDTCGAWGDARVVKKHRQGWSCLLDMSVLRFIFDLTHRSSSFSAQITASACGASLNEN